MIIYLKGISKIFDKYIKYNNKIKYKKKRKEKRGKNQLNPTL